MAKTTKSSKKREPAKVPKREPVIVPHQEPERIKLPHIPKPLPPKK